MSQSPRATVREANNVEKIQNEWKFPFHILTFTRVEWKIFILFEFMDELDQIYFHFMEYMENDTCLDLPPWDGIFIHFLSFLL